MKKKNWVLSVGCLMWQQHTSLSHAWTCWDNCTCCYTEIVVDQTFCLTLSQYTDTRPTSPSADCLYCQASDRVLSGKPFIKSLEWLDLAKSHSESRHWSPVCSLRGRLTIRPMRWSWYGANEVVMIWGQWGGHGMGPMRWSWYGANEVVMVWGQWGGHGMGPVRWSWYGASEVVMVWGQWGGHCMGPSEVVMVWGPVRWSWYGASEVVMVWGPVRWSLYGASEVVMV